MTFSHLSVHDFMSQLRMAMRDDASQLFRNKSEILKVENLLNHCPLTFLRERPEIIVYYKAKPLGLYDKFCNYGGLTLTKIESYSLAKVIEIEYKVITDYTIFTNILI